MRFIKVIQQGFLDSATKAAQMALKRRIVLYTSEALVANDIFYYSRIGITDRSNIHRFYADGFCGR